MVFKEFLDFKTFLDFYNISRFSRRKLIFDLRVDEESFVNVQNFIKNSIYTKNESSEIYFKPRTALHMLQT